MDKHWLYRLTDPPPFRAHLLVIASMLVLALSGCGSPGRRIGWQPLPEYVGQGTMTDPEVEDEYEMRWLR